MTYKVFISTPYQALVAIPFIVSAALFSEIPKHNQWILGVVWMLTIFLLVGSSWRSTWRNRTLSFEFDHLSFPRRSIPADDIARILLHEKEWGFTVYFKTKKVPIRVHGKWRTGKELTLQARQWAWQNGVTCDSDARRKSKK